MKMCYEKWRPASETNNKIQFIIEGYDQNVVNYNQKS